MFRISGGLAVALLLMPAAFAARQPTDGVIVRQAAAPVLQAIPTDLRLVAEGADDSAGYGGCFRL